MLLEFYSSSFCEPCMQTRAILAEVARIVPQATVLEYDVARNPDEASAEDIRSTPTVIVRAESGEQVFRASGVPTLQQVLTAAARAV